MNSVSYVMNDEWVIAADDRESVGVGEDKFKQCT